MKERIGAERPEPDKTRCDDIPWRCNRCQALLGYVDKATKRTIRVKQRDSYVWVTDPKAVSVPCRSCGAFNELLDETVDPSFVPPGSAAT